MNDIIVVIPHWAMLTIMALLLVPIVLSTVKIYLQWRLRRELERLRRLADKIRSRDDDGAGQ